VACLLKVLEENNDGVMQSPKGSDEMLLFGDDDRFPGNLRDGPAPSVIGGPAFIFVLVPQPWLDERSEENIKTVLENTSQTLPQAADPYYAFGGAMGSASDQANSLSQAHRDAAFMAFFSFTAAEKSASLSRKRSMGQRGSPSSRQSRRLLIHRLFSTATIVLETIFPRHPSLRMKMMSCLLQIGNPSESDEPPGAPSVSSFAAVISAIAVYVLINIKI